MAENAARDRSNRKTLLGKVVSDRMEKSIIVEVETRKKHPIFRKMVKQSHRFMTHDEKNESNVGDTVRIMETRPLSKNKRWRLVEIVERAK